MKKPAAPAPEAAPFATCDNFAQRVRGNPFSVLELPAHASRAEVERAAGRLLSLLELGNEKAAHYPTPFGSAPRTVEAVRSAQAQLRDPLARVLHECWAEAGAAAGAAVPVQAPPALPAPRGWLGWPPPREK